MNDYSNRRRHPRFEVDGLRGSIEGSPCELLRISAGGLLATSRLAPELERILHLEVQLSDEVFRSAGRVAFVGPDTREPGGHHRIGVEFIAVPRRSRQVLDRYLQSIANPPAP